MNKYFFEDQDIEEALLKTCLLFENKKMNAKKDSLFSKVALSLIISKKADTIDAIKEYIDSHNDGEAIVRSKINTIVAELTRKGILETSQDGILRLKKKVKEEAEQYVATLTEQLDKLVLKILEQVKASYKRKIQNEEQVKYNIKECLNYYFEVARLSFFNIDTPKDPETLTKVYDLSNSHLENEGKDLADHIVLALGTLLKTPHEEDQLVLEELSRLSITASIMGEDLMLNNFKTTIIKNKTFIVDTEVLLYLITDQARYSAQYKALIQQMLDCQCKIYVPEEVIREVSDHAEAASKRYGFISNLMRSNDPMVTDEFGNVFVEDYYYFLRKQGCEDTPWVNYISNYYDKRRPYDLIFDQLNEKLDERIILGELPEGTQIDVEKQEKLREPAFLATKNTPKGKYRDDAKNQAIADTDILLYLSTTSLNDKHQEHRPRRRESKVLRNDYYLLSNNSRIHICAKTLGISAQVLCKPKALVAYLAETGWIPRDKLKISSLFDNIFLMHLAKEAWPDIEKLIKVGVDFKGQEIVQLRYKLGDLLEGNFESEDPEEYKEVVKAIKERGIDLQPIVDSVTDDNLKKDKIIEGLREQMVNLELENQMTRQELDAAKVALEDKKKRKRLEAFQKRVGQYKGYD